MSDTHNVAYAAAIYTFTRTFGMCIGVAAGGAVFQNQLKKHLADLGLLTTVAADAEVFVVQLQALPKSSPEYQNYVLAFAKRFENVFKFLIAVASLAEFLNSMDKKLDKGRRKSLLLGRPSQTSTSEVIHGSKGAPAPEPFRGKRRRGGKIGEPCKSTEGRSSRHH